MTGPSEAINRWQAVGANADILANIHVRLSDLAGATVGRTTGKTIWIDLDPAD